MSEGNVCSALDIAKGETAAAIDLPSKSTLAYSIAPRNVRTFVTAQNFRRSGRRFSLRWVKDHFEEISSDLLWFFSASCLIFNYCFPRRS